jgi:hypothetical protein
MKAAGDDSPESNRLKWYRITLLNPTLLWKTISSLGLYKSYLAPFKNHAFLTLNTNLLEENKPGGKQ